MFYFLFFPASYHQLPHYPNTTATTIPQPRLQRNIFSGSFRETFLFLFRNWWKSMFYCAYAQSWKIQELESVIGSPCRQAKYWKIQKLAPSFACEQEHMKSWSQYLILTAHFKSLEVSCTAFPELTAESDLDSPTDHSELVLVPLVLHIWNVGNLTVKTLVIIIIGYCGSDLDASRCLHIKQNKLGVGSRYLNIYTHLLD